MRAYLVRAVLVLSVVVGIGSTSHADDYMVDAVHSGVSFQISHMGLSYIQGPIQRLQRTVFSRHQRPAKSSFSLTIKAESVDTNNSKRDEHLRAPDFFNVKQFPTITFTEHHGQGNRRGL